MHKIKKIFTILALLGNIAVIIFILLWLGRFAIDNTIISIILLLLMNILFLANYLFTKSETGFISLYFKRKELEEMLKIKELKEKIKET